MPAAIVNCDWGTSRLRVRTFRLDRSQVTAEFRSLEGVATLAESYPAAQRPEVYQNLLLEGLRPLVDDQPELLTGAPILVSGMASSSIGWHELPYARLPLPVDGSGLTWRDVDPLESKVGTHRVVLVSGARSDVDVMRGEETELVGLFTLPQAEKLTDNALVIKPGTHSKHLRVQGGRLTEFQTFMTGELFDVLCRHSILQHSTRVADGTADSPPDLESLREGVRAGAAMPLGAALFRVRTRQLLSELPAAANRAFLSGLLIGSELAYLTSRSDGQLPLVLCATTPLFAAYRAALDELGLVARTTMLLPEETELLSARGQAAIWRQICQV